MQETTRKIEEMSEMYGLPKDLYTMKRGVRQKKGMRYDITIIPPLVINGHYNKTKGHIHKTGHDEIYIVLEGKAMFQFQNKKKFWWESAKKGDRIEVPGSSHHVTVNPSKTKTLKLANWISDECVSDYSYVAKHKGMRYYYTTDGWVRNPNYKW